MAVGVAIKTILMGILTLAIVGYGLYLLFTGQVVAGLLLIFIVEPIAMFIADLATGLIVALLVAVGAVAGAAVPGRVKPAGRPAVNAAVAAADEFEEQVTLPGSGYRS